MIYFLYTGRNLDRLVSFFHDDYDVASQSEVFNLETAALH